MNKKRGHKPSFLNLIRMFKNFLQILSLFPFISMLYSGDLKDTESNLLDERIESYLSSMTLEDKVGQIFMIEMFTKAPPL